MAGFLKPLDADQTGVLTKTVRCLVKEGRLRSFPSRLKYGDHGCAMLHHVATKATHQRQKTFDLDVARCWICSWGHFQHWLGRCRFRHRHQLWRQQMCGLWLRGNHGHSEFANHQCSPSDASKDMASMQKKGRADHVESC